MINTEMFGDVFGPRIDGIPFDNSNTSTRMILNIKRNYFMQIHPRKILCCDNLALWAYRLKYFSGIYWACADVAWFNVWKIVSISLIFFCSTMTIEMFGAAFKPWVDGIPFDNSNPSTRKILNIKRNYFMQNHRGKFTTYSINVLSWWF